jgi:UDP-N-acetylglucosamine 4-epimerase
MGKKILLTGGAGFIGSNIADALIGREDVDLVRVLDNLATGKMDNIQHLLDHPKFEFIKGDIRDIDTCLKAATTMDMVCHQAALGSVPRSIEDPLTTNDVNITGTLNIFNAARFHNIKRVVYAASSSTYGDSLTLPKVEDTIGKPLSPYAVTKYVNELYANVFGALFGLELIGLRYFNVFGPRQDPNGAYAAVIPLFAKAVIDQNSTFYKWGWGTKSGLYVCPECCTNQPIGIIYRQSECRQSGI